MMLYVRLSRLLIIKEIMVVYGLVVILRLAGSAAAQTPPLKVVFPSFSGAFTPLWMGHDLGLFASSALKSNPFSSKAVRGRRRRSSRAISMWASCRAV